ncbi:MAG: hypothetical protein L0241_29945 [Planctomycetia bacterium]|nr:hypothetical protein [Planctomycetia bacterium]
MRTLIGLLLACVVGGLVVGCNPKGGGGGGQGKDGHDHGPGPHNGVIVELGDEDYHLEFVTDQGTKEAIVYILDEEAKNAKPITTKQLTLSLKEQPPVTITLDAKPQEGDPAGTSSRFVGKHDVLGTKKEFEGTIGLEIEGKKYSGEFK